jgi:DNA-directed RNA polymerase specialized sigma24 family protein
LNPLEKLALKHKTWVHTVISFGCDPAIAEDIVQEAYIKINKLIEKGLDISYGEEINYFYVYKTLKTLYGDLLRQNKKIKKVDIDALNKYIIEEEEQVKDVDVSKKMQELNNILDSIYWYDRKVFEIISSGVTIAELSRKTNITYASLYNTYRNVKNIIKNNIQWD